MQYIASVDNWIVVLAALAIVGLCVTLHYEVLAASSRYLPVLIRRQRPRVLVLICFLLAAHVAEIWLFGLGYYWLATVHALGGVTGLPAAQIPEFVYFSAMTYTTVGFGDAVPLGPLRFLAGMEALTGLVMVAWSASYTYLEMQRDWLR
jgi:hypothetical protein